MGLSSNRADWTLVQTLRRVTEAYPDAVCVKSVDGQTSYTYTQIAVWTEQRARGLEQRGVKPGDHVVVMMDNSVEMLVTWFAINVLGAVEVPCNTANRGPSLEHVLNNSESELAIVDADYVEVISSVSGNLAQLKTLVVNGSLPDTHFEALSLAQLDVTSGDVQLRSRTVTSSEPAAIIYTSGTTGPAKGVVVPHAHMHAFASHVIEHLIIEHGDVYYVCLPLFHANAQFMQVIPSLMVGATIVLADHFSASSWVSDLEQSGATVTSLLGVMAQYVYDRPRTHSDATHSVRRMITIPIPAAIAEDFENRFNTRCVEAYGMTEVCLPIYRPLNAPLKPGSCGKSLDDWFHVQIVDPITDEVVETGDVGEVVVRPRYPFTTFLGYHGMPKRTIESWRNLWFHTGDAAYQDDEGYYYFVDRLNDRIRRKGENVTTYDIEMALTELDFVYEAAVVAKPAREGEDEIKAFLVVSDPAAVDPIQILEHCSKRLAYFAIPRYLEFIPEFPKTATGKVLKRELRSLPYSNSEWDRETAGYTIQRKSPHLVRKTQ